MDESVVRSIVDREIEPLMNKLGIPHWDVKLRYDHIDPPRGSPSDWSCSGRCERNSPYNKAYITIDPAMMEDEDMVLRTLRHELFHVLLAPIDLYRDHMDSGTEPDSPAWNQEAIQFRHAIEQTVINLQRMWHGLVSEPASVPKVQPPYDRLSGPSHE